MKAGDVEPLELGAYDESAIFLDNSLLSAFRQCEELCRLSHVLHLKPKEGIPALDFGGMFHAGVAAWHMANSGFIADEKGKFNASTTEITEEGALKLAHLAVLHEGRSRGTTLPLGLSDDKRSVERCLNLVEAYIHRWRQEPLSLVKDSHGRPYVEIKFRVFLFTHTDGRPVFYCGIIDSLKTSRIDGKIKINETKSTTIGLEQFLKQIRPNHQLTGYVHSVRELIGIDTSDALWDCAFISSRQAQPGADPWLSRGIDMKKDFARRETTRSNKDINEWLFDTIMTAQGYLQRLDDKDLTRWIRNGANACHNYGGCTYREPCGNNLNQAYLDAKFKIEKWEPWKDA